MYTQAGLEANDDYNDDDELQSGYIRNSYFNIEFLEYLIRNIFVYGCMFDHSLLKLNGCTTTQDTNSPVESWNSVRLGFTLYFFDVPR